MYRNEPHGAYDEPAALVGGPTEDESKRRVVPFMAILIAVPLVILGGTLAWVYLPSTALSPSGLCKTRRHRRRPRQSPHRRPRRCCRRRSRPKPPRRRSRHRPRGTSPGRATAYTAGEDSDPTTAGADSNAASACPGTPSRPGACACACPDSSTTDRLATRAHSRNAARGRSTRLSFLRNCPPRYRRKPPAQAPAKIPAQVPPVDPAPKQVPRPGRSGYPQQVPAPVDPAPQQVPDPVGPAPKPVPDPAPPAKAPCNPELELCGVK